MGLNNISQNKKNKKTTTTAAARRTRTSFALLTSVLVLSSFAAVQLATSNAYAQSTGATVTGSCELDSHGSLDLSFHMTGKPFPTRYYYQLLDSSGTVLDTDPSGGSIDEFSGFTYSYTAAKLGGQYTLNLYEDVDNDFPAAGVEEDEHVASDTVTCPSYTDLFSNKGQCLKYARTHSGGIITKSGCQEAF
jgi:hypothetical protein